MFFVRPFMKLFLITASIFILAACKNGDVSDENPRKVVRPVKMMTIPSGADLPIFIFPGKVRASQRVDMAFQVPGPLIELPVKEGQDVKKGDLLARIDPTDFQTRLRQAEGQLAKAKAANDRARSEYDRILRIKNEDPGATSQNMIDRKREAIESAKAELNTSRAGVDEAENQLRYTYLRAPFSGMIAKRYVDNFQEVQAKQPIFKLQDVTHLEILVDLPETIVATARADSATAFAEFAAAPGKQYDLTFKEVAKEADPCTQTYRVVMTLPAPGEINILPGMTARVVGRALMGDPSGHQSVIPAIAVFSDETGTSHVWVVNLGSMTVSKRKVTTGNLAGTHDIQILNGLNPGEKIAVSGIAQLREGMLVRELRALENHNR